SKEVRLLEKNVTLLQKIAKRLKKEEKFPELASFQEILNNRFSGIRKITKTPDLYREINSSWMQELPLEIKKKSITALILPKTHDSGAYTFRDFNKTPSGTWGRIAKVARIGKILGLKNYIRDWTRCQRLSIYEQLKQGIRAFDFRITYNPDDKKL